MAQNDKTKAYLASVQSHWTANSVWDVVHHACHGLVRCSKMQSKSRSGDLCFILQFTNVDAMRKALKQVKQFPRPWTMRPSHKQTDVFAHNLSLAHQTQARLHKQI